MRKIMLPAAFIAVPLTALLMSAAGAGGTDVDDAAVGEHMVAEATLTAHYIAAALAAGQTPEEISATLQKIAGETVISDFWVTDETGEVVFSSQPGTQFSFGTNPNADHQSAPFAALLTGQQTVVVQESQPRDLDGAVYRYAAVAGVDGRRIVQVGLKAE